jgi:hypothetical protein
MRSQLRATTTLRSLSCTLQGSLLGESQLLALFVFLQYIFLDQVQTIVFCCVSNSNLHFVETPALAPPDVTIDMAAQQQ